MNPRRSRRAASRIQSTARRLISARQPGSSDDAEPRRDRRRAPASTADPRRVSRARPPVDGDVHFAQAVVAHHDLMHRQRVEQLVRDQHALERLGESPRGRWPGDRATSPSVVALRRARRGARFDEMQAESRRRGLDRAASRRGGYRPTAGRFRRRLRRDRTGLGASRLWDSASRRLPRSAAISAIWTSSSSPKSGPTSTLVKKSPARPDRWAARA